MNRNDNQGHISEELLAYADKKRRIQAAIAMAKDAEREIDRDMEAELKRKVAEGQQA